MPKYLKTFWLNSASLFILTFTPYLQAKPFPWFDSSLTQAERIDALVAAMTLEEKTSQMLNASPAIPRLGLVEYDWWNEALHGVARSGKATVFPQPIGLAATFDDELLYQAALSISDEARAKYNLSQTLKNRTRYAGLTFWTPNINIFRDPRWGRGMETYGEDPYLTSQMGLAMAKGLQGEDVNFLKTAATAKHYAVHSGPEALRHEFDAITTKKDLFETYLPAFEVLVKQGNVKTVMGAYNRVNGEPANGSKYLLQEILRDNWGFEGHVVSDCWALVDFHKFHKVSKSATESAAMALKAGVDLNCGEVYNHLDDAVKEGLVPESLVDQRLKKLLETRFQLGMMDPPEASPYYSISPTVINSDAHAELSYQTAVKSIVMLQNKKHVLPLKNDMSTLYVTGPLATSTQVLMGNYYGVSSRYTTFLEGIAAAVSAGTSLNYKQGILPYQENVNPIDWTTGEAQAADAMIVSLGIDGAYEGEEGEAIASAHAGDRISLALPKHQIEFLRKLRKGYSKPIIAVITAGSPVILTEISKLADAILFAWYPGQEGGRALADILFGNVSPSGRLPITFPKSESQLPPYNDYAMKGRTYRYMTKSPMYTFGFGLSYSSSQFANLRVSGIQKRKIINDKIVVKVDVKNTGQTAIEEVVQFYLQTPKAGKGQPLSSLKKFKRIKLNPGQQKNVEVHLSTKDLLSINSKGKAVLISGTYTLLAGNASPGKRSKELGAAKMAKVHFKL